ncbi:MAG: hypothetical protein C0612_09625, partial [Desulfobulbaceae bacterium]
PIQQYLQKSIPSYLNEKFFYKALYVLFKTKRHGLKPTMSVSILTGIFLQKVNMLARNFYF